MAKPLGPTCNLNCGYCYYLAKTSLFPAGEHFRMTDAVLEAYVRSFIEASPGPIIHFVWHGGEPTLVGLDFYRKVLVLQERYLPPEWTCINNLQTNGVLLDEEWCAFLAEHRFHVGLSIDGPARFHDAFRVDNAGRPTHQRVTRALRLLQRNGIEPDVLCTLTSVTAPHPQEVYRFFVDHGVTWLQFLPVVQRTPDGTVSEFSVAPEAMGTFLCTVFDEWVRHDMRKLVVQTFAECMNVWLGRPASLCTMAETCGRALAIEHDGGVYSCDHFVENAHKIGNVSTDALAVLIDAPEQVAFGLAKRDALPDCCKECSVLAVCNGGCPKDRFIAAPNGQAGLSYLCAGYRQFYQHISPYMERMAALARNRKPVSGIMDELKLKEAAGEEPWRTASRNDRCPCGSGRKFKRCCLSTHRPRL